MCVYSIRGEHIESLRHVLARCRAYNISLNPLKCHFMVTYSVVLGHVVSRRGIATHNDKVKVILELDPPSNSKGVQVFVGHINYCQCFMKYYDVIEKPMFSLISKFEWCEEVVVAFERLKKLLASTPILRSPD